MSQLQWNNVYLNSTSTVPWGNEQFQNRMKSTEVQTLGAL